MSMRTLATTVPAQMQDGERTGVTVQYHDVKVDGEWAR